ncbi:hypothetical protein [Streptomyces sp. NRRL F-3307]
MPLHEGALVAHGLNTFADPIDHARGQAQALLSGAEDDAANR